MDVTAVEHYEAVQAFHTAKDLVNLKVVRQPYDGDDEDGERVSQVGTVLCFQLVLGILKILLAIGYAQKYEIESQACNWGV